MDFIDFTITFTVIYNIALFGCIITILYKTFKYFLNLNNDEFNLIAFILSLCTFTVVGTLLLPYLLIVVFDGQYVFLRSHHDQRCTATVFI